MCVEQPIVCNECLKLNQNWSNPCPHWKTVKRIVALEKKNIKLLNLIRNISITKYNQYCDICYEEFGMHCAECRSCLNSDNPICINKKCSLAKVLK